MRLRVLGWFMMRTVMTGTIFIEMNIGEVCGNSVEYHRSIGRFSTASDGTVRLARYAGS
jgi:hypothetical protein